VETNTDLSPKKNSSGSSSRKVKEIKWNEWNPFQRATGRALQQLIKKQRKQKELDDAPEALL